MRLKEIRLLSQMTQQAAADKIGCSLKVYSNYERGEREPSIEMLIKIARCFNVTVDFLIENDIGEPVLPALSDFELQLIQASRNADVRAKSDALSILEKNKQKTKKID